MNQSLPFLSSRTNLPEVWEANSAGKFSVGQKANIDPLNIDHVSIERQEQALADGCMIFVLATTGRLILYGTFVFITALGWRFAELINQMPAIVLALLLTASLIYVTVQNERDIYKDKKRRAAQKMLRPKPVPFTPTVYQASGQVEFVADGLTPLVKLNDLSFEIMGELWWQLRDMGERFTIYYTILRSGTRILLSIEPLDYPHAPSVARLETVIGFGDDGELVYADEVKTSVEI